MKRGQLYAEANQSICINILNYNMFDCKEYHSEFSVMENSRHELFTDKLSLHFFELGKVSDDIDRENLMQLWLQLIKADSEDDFNMLRGTKVPIIEKSVETLYELSSDEKVRIMAWEREKTERDYLSAITTARREGEARGEAKGIAKGEAIGAAKERATMAARLKKLGFSDAEIQNIISD